jgi:hypothetical protein
MGIDDSDYNAYLERKKKLRKVHAKLKDTKEVQEIYHKLMGSQVGEDPSDGSDLPDDS